MSKASSSRAVLESVGANRYSIQGSLDASTVTRLLADSRNGFASAANLEVDLQGVTDADSAGLALMIEWMRVAKQGNRQIRFDNVPEQIRALARISEVESLLFGSEAAEAQPT